MECPEFRALLLFLRDDLKVDMIPHRTKMRELVITSWKESFQALKRELQVCLLNILALLNPFLIFFGQVRGREGFFHSGHLVQSKSPIISGHNRPLGCEGRRDNLATTQGCPHRVSQLTG
jgi:hypothetical protein